MWTLSHIESYPKTVAQSYGPEVLQEGQPHLSTTLNSSLSQKILNDNINNSMNQPWCIGLSIFYHRGCPYACCSFPQKQLFKLMQLQITINVLAEKPKNLLSFIITDLPFIILPEAAAFPSVWLRQDSLLLNPPIYSRALKMSQPWLIKVIVVKTRQILHAQEVDVSLGMCADEVLRQPQSDPENSADRGWQPLSLPACAKHQ